MSTNYKSARGEGFGYRGDTNKNIRRICKKAGLNDSLMGSGTVPVLRAKLRSKTLLVVKKTMRF